MVLCLCSCVTRVSSVETGFYLLGESPDRLVELYGVPDKTYKSKDMEVYEYINSIGTSVYAQSIPNYSYGPGYSNLSSIDTYGTASSRAVTSKYIIKNNKIVSFTTPDGSGQMN